MFPVIHKSPEVAFREATGQLISDRKAFGFLSAFSPGTKHLKLHRKAFDVAFSNKSGYKNNVKMSWGQWLCECVFPEYLYKANGSSLDRLLKDKRFYYEPTFHKKESCHSHMGRMCRPRDSMAKTQYAGYLDYTLDRWRRDNHKSFPHFYFDVETPEWMFAELFKNPNQIKSGRTATSCTGNFAFRWDSVGKRPIFYQILKHSQYSHIYGDFCGSAAFMRAFCKELSLDISKAVVMLFAISVSMDAVKEARQYLTELRQTRLDLKGGSDG
jgi:hypothetical protein